MVGTFRPRRLATVVLLGAIALGLAACDKSYPNSTFNKTSDFNSDVLSLWNSLLIWGTIVFVGVEAALIYTIFRFRRRPNSTGEPKQVHGHTMLEIAWTAIPAVILIFIAIPTVRTIFRTQAKAAPDALQVEVIGHQWWWEFNYPQYGVKTANELYLPVGRTVNFHLKTVDVLHSFWVPQLGGKRDLITNRTNYLWYTPVDSVAGSAYNGFCAEYCGASHANMRFRTYTVTPAEFEQWVAHQQGPAVFPAGLTSATTATPVSNPTMTPPVATAATQQDTMRQARADQGTAQAQSDSAAQPATQRAPVFAFDAGRMRTVFPHTIPNAPIPKGIEFDDALLAGGNAERGMTVYNRTCIGCHSIGGTRFNTANIGPNLTHVGSRNTIAAGLYPNDARHLARWIKNAPVMKPGSLMPTQGQGIQDPIRPIIKGTLTDQQIADIVAYLQALK